ncbi:MAG: histidine--tRNA ligase [Pseudomonadota bacterium]
MQRGIPDITGIRVMAKKNKPQKTKPRVPRGLRDVSASEIRGVDDMLRVISEVYESYGFEPVETPLIEYTDALGKFLPDEDRPNQGVFSFQDDDEQWLSLRYDLTAPLARHVAEQFNDIAMPYRTYRSGWVFRNEKPGPGRYRQFMQMDADTVGASSVAADAEICMMAADTMEALGFELGEYVIRVNNRKVLDGVMEAIGVTDETQKLTVLRAIDKLDKFGVEGVRQLLGDGRKDESGDFTKGAGLDEGQIQRVLRYVDFGIPAIEEGTELLEADDAVVERGVVPEHSTFGMTSEAHEAAFVGNNRTTVDVLFREFADSSEVKEGLKELEEFSQIITSSGYLADRIKIDPSVVRGLEYYTGPVFEAELLFEVTDEKTGQPVRFGSVGGGGRYDGLVSRFRGQPVPATGFSVGVSRLYAALQKLGKVQDVAHAGPVVVCVMDKDQMASYQQMAAELRGAGIRAEVFLGNPKQFGKQLQYADRRGAPVAIIEGSDERDRGVIQIKDLIEGAKAAQAIESNEEYREARVGQDEALKDELVPKVKAILKKHGISYA